MLKHSNYFHVPIDKSALLFFHRHLVTILVVTFEPFEVFNYVTTHLKAKDPLQGPRNFFKQGNSGEMVYTPWLVVNFLGSSGN